MHNIGRKISSLISSQQKGKSRISSPQIKGVSAMQSIKTPQRITKKVQNALQPNDRATTNKSKVKGRQSHSIGISSRKTSKKESQSLQKKVREIIPSQNKQRPSAASKGEKKVSHLNRGCKQNIIQRGIILSNKGLSPNRVDQVQIHELIAMETERVSKLKASLREDSQRLHDLKKNSDEKVIAQVHETQGVFQQKLREIQEQNKQMTSTYKQKIKVIEDENNQLKINQGHQIDTLRRQLAQQRDISGKLEKQLSECQQMNQCVKSELAKKQAICRQLQAESAGVQVCQQHGSKLSLLETQISCLQTKVSSYQNIKADLEARIQKHEREKAYIKRSSEQVLGLLFESVRQPKCSN